MSLSQLKKLESDIVEYNQQIKNIHKEMISLNNKLASTKNQKWDLEFNLFLEYLPLDYTIEFVKPTVFDGSPYFKAGEVVKIFKKNKKSIVIKRVRKFFIDNTSQPPVTKYIDCDENYRVKISGVYHFLSKDDSFKKQFYSYLKRKESLENLGF
jgi:hypothetical protein